MDITDYLASIGVKRITGNTPQIRLFRHLRKKQFKPVRQTGSDGWFIDFSYLTNGYYFAEIHDDNHFYFWVTPETPLISITIDETNFKRINGLITRYLKKCGI